MATLAVDPSRRVNVTLRIEKDLPEDERATFTTQFLTGRQRLALTEKATAADRARTFRKATPILIKALGSVLIGWKNLLNPETGKMLEFKVGATEIDKGLTFHEMMELVSRILVETELKEQEIKKSLLPLQSSKETSAENAGEESPGKTENPAAEESQS